MNHVMIAGHLGADAETRFTPAGMKVTSLRIATNSRRGNRDETIWWRATIWGDRFDKLLPYLKKGSALIVSGELSKPEIYTDKEGQSQVVLNITVEAVRFSPFGRSERTDEKTGSASPAEPSEEGFAYSNQGYAKGYPTGASVQPGSGQGAHVPGDNVPF